jgi:two-component system sensor histidine kinase KdpD
MAGYAWSSVGIAIATGLMWLARGDIDTGLASLLYLPVVIGVAIQFGFGPAVVGAVFSFALWDFFFLAPRFTFIIENPRDWLSLVVFLVVAVTTARLASGARVQAAKAEAREAEMLTLFQASETISNEVEAADVIAVLSDQVRALCRSSRCTVWKAVGSQHRLVVMKAADRSEEPIPDDVRRLAEATAEHRQPIGFDKSSSALWSKALGEGGTQVGVHVPLFAENRLVGVLYVGPTLDAKPFTPTEQRLILTLANHVAVVIARQSLADAAAQTEALREADVLKDALLSMVSHELRSPLAAIKATASGLRGRIGDVAIRDELDAINSQADRLTNLVSNLLDLSRLEAGAWKPKRDWCDLTEILGTALDRLPTQAADRVKVDDPSNLPLVKADYTQIAIVLTNILENAAKYSPADKPILVSIDGSSEQGGSSRAGGVLVRIRDYGKGIASGEEDAIFARFFRGGEHVKSAIRGTGLGLALCEAIVRAHGGKIWAANAPAGEPAGAVFSVWLPME